MERSEEEEAAGDRRREGMGMQIIIPWACSQARYLLVLKVRTYYDTNSYIRVGNLKINFLDFSG